MVVEHPLELDLDPDGRSIDTGDVHRGVDQPELGQDLVALVAKPVRNEPDELGLVFRHLNLNRTYKTYEIYS